MSSDLARGLAEFLGSGSGHAVTVSNVEYLSAGARRRNVAFDADMGGAKRRLVATIVPNAIELVPVDVEAAVRELARGNGVPVPPVVAICTDSAYADGPFVVSERVDGETVPRKVLRLTESAGLGERVAEQLGEAMGRLHAIDPATAPARLPEAAADPEHQLIEAGEHVRALLADRPVFALALRWLERRCPPAPPRTALLHTDMRTATSSSVPRDCGRCSTGKARSVTAIRCAMWPGPRCACGASAPTTGNSADSRAAARSRAATAVRAASSTKTVSAGGR